jgi:hypothetical protein
LLFVFGRIQKHLLEKKNPAFSIGKATANFPHGWGKTIVKVPIQIGYSETICSISLMGWQPTQPCLLPSNSYRSYFEKKSPPNPVATAENLGRPTDIATPRFGCCECSN